MVPTHAPISNGWSHYYYFIIIIIFSLNFVINFNDYYFPQKTLPYLCNKRVLNIVSLFFIWSQRHFPQRVMVKTERVQLLSCGQNALWDFIFPQRVLIKKFWSQRVVKLYFSHNALRVQFSGLDRNIH